MVWPVVAAIAVATLVTGVRVGRRAWVRFRDLPPEAFGIKSHYDIHAGKYFKGGFNEKMSISEAQMILGVDDLSRLTEKLLNQRHRTTMLMNHPDRGGSKYIAMKINEAKDVLRDHKGFKK
ncbi:mitochondrial DnaJ homolog 2 [Trichomonascus vanleenenianus]|uniref:Mdj2p n=1 Tax=Trichomonascus vanleenenianus TaxID=2268995 RepID=UPI003ECB880E